MSIKVILFDHDGTLLPMDYKRFGATYFTTLGEKMKQHGYDPKKLSETILSGILSMAKNTGERSNEQVFWDEFCKVYGEKAKDDAVFFDEYYHHDFEKVRSTCGYDPKAKQTLDALHEMGYRTVLATNPIFPAIATQARMRWAGVSPEDFEFYTTYENSRFSKPNPKYYLDIAKTLGVLPEECLMVGNDVIEDMVAQTVGMKVFLMPEYILNRENKDTSAYPQGDFDDLLAYIRSL